MNLSRLVIHKYDNRRLFAVFLVVFVALLIDISLSNISDIITNELVSFWGVLLFTVISGIYVLGQYCILKLVSLKNKEIDTGSTRINWINNLMKLTQYILTAVVILTVLEIIILSYYHTAILIVSVAASYGITAILMGVLARRLFAWFMMDKKSIAVLLYGLAASVIAINAIASILMFDVVLLEKSTEINSQSKVIFDVGFPPYTAMSVVAELQSISLVGFFLLTWGATAILMRHHVKRIGRVKYWALVSLPLVYFMSYYITFYQNLNPTNPFQAGPGLMFPIFMITYAIALCGILFGIGFRSISGSVDVPGHVKDYMTITAIGFILFFNANDATVLQAAYPPFGLANVAFVGLSSYLIFTGLYYSALSVASDVNLRRSIRHSAKEGSKLLDSIGSAHERQELEKRVVTLTKEKTGVITKETGIEPSLSEREAVDYLNEVMKELERSKKL